MYMMMGNHTKSSHLLQKIEDAEAESGGEDNTLDDNEEEEEVVDRAGETINAVLDDGVDDEAGKAGTDNETEDYVVELQFM